MLFFETSQLRFSTNTVTKTHYSIRHFMKLSNSATSNPGNCKRIDLLSASEVPKEIK